MPFTASRAPSAVKLESCNEVMQIQLRIGMRIIVYPCGAEQSLLVAKA